VVKFLNQPKISGHEADRDLDKAKIYLIPKIEEFILNHLIFTGESINVSFLHTGISSLVCLIESVSYKYILKMKLRPSDVNMEASFLVKWEELGIKVPHIYEIGKLEDYNYILMEYIDSDILTKVYNIDELISKNIFFEMGQILNKIHTLKTKGYGHWVANEQAQYNTFEDWINNESFIQKQIKYTKDNNLLPEEIFGSFEEKIHIMIDFVNKDKTSTYCHLDFSPNNILATDPITIFDPVCLINHPYIDLARSIIQSTANCHDFRGSEQIIDGYCHLDKNLFDKEIFKAFLLFTAYLKFPYWHKKNKTDIIDLVKGFLLKNNI